MADMIIVYNMYKEYFTHKTYRTEKRVKTSEKTDETTTMRLPNELCLRDLFNTRRIKLSLFDG